MKLTEIRNRFIEEKDEANKAKQHLDGTIAEVSRLQDLFLRGQAGFLAGTLMENSPCPVCGSKAHPAPAAKLEGAPDKESLDAAAERNLKAQEDYNKKSLKYSNSLVEGKAQKDFVDKLREALEDKYRTETAGLEKEELSESAEGQLKTLQAEIRSLKPQLLEATTLKDKEARLAADLEAEERSDRESPEGCGGAGRKAQRSEVKACIRGEAPGSCEGGAAGGSRFRRQPREAH